MLLPLAPSQAQWTSTTAEMLCWALRSQLERRLQRPITSAERCHGSTGIATSLVYYIVGTQVLRIIDVDTKDTAVSSSFVLSSNPNFTPSSIFSSVFSFFSTLVYYEAVSHLLLYSESKCSPSVRSETKTNQS